MSPLIEETWNRQVPYGVAVWNAQTETRRERYQEQVQPFILEIESLGRALAFSLESLEQALSEKDAEIDDKSDIGHRVLDAWHEALSQHSLDLGEIAQLREQVQEIHAEKRALTAIIVEQRTKLDAVQALADERDEWCREDHSNDKPDPGVRHEALIGTTEIRHALALAYPCCVHCGDDRDEHHGGHEVPCGCLK